MSTLCLYNPKAGRFALARLEKAFAGRAFWGEVRFQSLAEPAWRPGPEALAGYARVAVFGGDGTVHHAVQHLAFGPAELCVLPAGTANDLAHSIGLPLDLGRALALLETGKAVRYDTISANGRHVLTGGGFGLGYLAASSANRLRSGRLGPVFRTCLRAKIYLVTLAWHGLVAPPSPIRFRLSLDGAAREGITQSILFTNQSLMGKRVLIAPDTSPLDGTFHLIRFRHENTAGILRTLARLKAGVAREDALLERSEAASAEFEFGEAVPCFGDGEEFPPESRWSLRCHRGALRLRVPAAFGAAHA